MAEQPLFATMGELERLAEQKMEPHVWNYAMGGSGSETTLRRNRRALERWAIEQRVLVDVREIDLSIELFGETLPLPIVIAPMGSCYRFWPEGDIVMAQGAHRLGVAATVSGVTGWPMEQIARDAGGPLIFQLYHFGDRDWVGKRLERVQGCPEYKAICLTVDVAVYSRRDRDLAGRYVARSSARPDTLPEPGVPDHDYPERLTWADVDWLRQQVRIPFGLKGILSVADAQRALDAGVDFIWISNHGGRQLDEGRATADVLPEIAEAVGGRVPLIVDGGFQRGADVLKGIALGATAVAMAKAASWGLAVNGADGVAAMLAILRDELRIAMGLSGNTSVRRLTPEALHRIDY